MKRSIFLAAVFVTTLLLSCSVESSAQMKKGAVVWPAADIKWAEMKGGPPGIMYANLWGAIDKGMYGTLVKLPAGMTDALHTHSSDTKLVILSGTFLYTPEGGTEQQLGPGSYLMVPKGVRHTSGVSADGPCEVFQEGTGKFDFVPAEAKEK
jgi:quercetin dioxygenase-like cupin family protein